MTYLLTTSIYYVMNMSLNSKSDTSTHTHSTEVFDSAECLAMRGGDLIVKLK